MRYDLLIRGGRVVDPANGRDAVCDIAAKDGLIALAEKDINPAEATEVIDARGLLVTPGLVDTHVHIVRKGSRGAAYTMLLRRGVTTALDMSGGIDDFLPELAEYGRGMTAGCLHALAAGSDLPGNDADRPAVSDAIDRVLDKGAFGVKILGGHYPFTPKTTALIMEECAKRKAYVSIHAGTTETGSNIQGVEEAVQLAAGNPLHLAHANAYLRGQIEDPLTESARLLACLEANPNIVSESYLSVMNGTNATLDETGVPLSAVTRTWLTRKGYTADRDGMGRAILDGWALIYARVGGEMDYLPPEEGLRNWQEAGYAGYCSFPVNNPVAMLACATARRKDGSFTVDAISTDGGSIPRNVIFANGIRLVQMRYMTMADFVSKATWYPARMLGLLGKGHLTIGADADIAVFDEASATARYTITAGKVRMAAGVCMDGPGTCATWGQGVAAVRKAGIALTVPNLDKSTYLAGH